jgi:hypothetical protein
MAVSAQEQAQIQSEIQLASEEELLRLRAAAERILAEMNARMGQRLLSRDEIHAGEVAVEFIVRLEATQLGKGAWYRAKRRLQVTQTYLGR